MSTTIEVGDTLIYQAMQDTGEPTERAVVEAGLQLLIQMRAIATATSTPSNSISVSR